MSRAYLMFRAMIFGVILITLHSVVVFAQFQRMAIPVGSYSIPAQGISRLPAYCMDYTREAPRPGMSYGHVLRGGSTTRIRVGNDVLTIEEGVKRGLVAFEGSEITLDNLIDGLCNPTYRARLSEEILAQTETFVQLWDAASEEERNQLREMFTPMIQDQEGGDYTSLSVRSLTDQPVILEVGETIVVGAEAESTSDLPDRLIPGSENPQEDYWYDRNLLHQRDLQELGYYSGPIDGDFGPKSREALRSFQDAFHVDEKDGIGPCTQAELDAALTRTRTLRKTNEGTGRDAVAFRLERYPETDPDMLFVLFDEGGRPAARTNDVGELLQVLKDNPHVRNVSSIYLDAPGFTEAELAGLRTSLSIRQGSVANDLRVRPLHRADVPEASQTPFFDRGVELVRISEITEAIDRPGFNKAEIVITGLQGQNRLRVFARVRVVLQRFLGRISSLFTTSDRIELSPSELIHDTIRSIRQHHPELRDEDLQIEFEDQFGVIQIVGNLRQLDRRQEAYIG